MKELHRAKFSGKSMKLPCLLKKHLPPSTSTSAPTQNLSKPLWLGFFGMLGLNIWSLSISTTLPSLRWWEGIAEKFQSTNHVVSSLATSIDSWGYPPATSHLISTKKTNKQKNYHFGVTKHFSSCVPEMARDQISISYYVTSAYPLISKLHLLLPSVYIFHFSYIGLLDIPEQTMQTPLKPLHYQFFCLEYTSPW